MATKHTSTQAHKHTNKTPKYNRQTYKHKRHSNKVYKHANQAYKHTNKTDKYTNKVYVINWHLGLQMDNNLVTCHIICDRLHKDYIRGYMEVWESSAQTR